MRVASCDTLVALGSATAGQATIFAKNSDRPPGECQPLALVERAEHREGATVRCQYVEIPQVRRTARVLGSKPVWLWGFEHGINEHGLVIGNEAIFTREVPAASGLLGMDLVRLGLERAGSVEEALEVLTRLIEEHGQGGSGFRAFEFRYDNSFLLADSKGAWILEAPGRHWAARRCRSTDAISNQITIGSDWERLSDGLRVHAHEQGLPVSEPFDFSETYRDVENIPRALSEGRLRRSRTRLGEAAGEIEIPFLLEVLRDHGESNRRFRPGASPDSEAYYTICMHEGLSRTTASLVAELDTARRGLPLVWASFGRPCCGVFFPVVLAGRLPELLTQATEDPSDALWWVFEKIALAVEQNPDLGERVRDHLDPLEAELFEEGRAARGELEDLSGDAAESYAAAFMARIAECVADAARKLLVTIA